MGTAWEKIIWARFMGQIIPDYVCQAKPEVVNIVLEGTRCRDLLVVVLLGCVAHVVLVTVSGN